MLLINVSAVYADCTTQSGNFYSFGSRSLPSGTTANGVRGSIEMTQGQVCTSGVSHSVTLKPSSASGEWVQIGWRYYSGYSTPKAYCEANSPYGIQEFSVTFATHAYRIQYDSFDQYFDCYIDSSGVWSYSATSLGWTQGSYLNGQGEAHQNHVQIGRTAPSKLLFSDLQYRNASTGSWPLLDLVLAAPPAPYGNDEPSPGTLRVWTNAH